MFESLRQKWDGVIEDNALDLYKLSPPSKYAVEKRERLVAESITKMGKGKYLNVPFKKPQDELPAIDQDIVKAA